MKLTRNQFRQLESLTQNPNLNRDELERLLIDLVGPKIAGQLTDAIAGLANANGASHAAGELNSASGAIESRAGDVKSKVKELDSHSGSGGEGPSTKAPRSDKNAPVEKPNDSTEKPEDDRNPIDKPLGGVEPKNPSVLEGTERPASFRKDSISRKVPGGWCHWRRWCPEAPLLPQVPRDLGLSPRDP